MTGKACAAAWVAAVVALSPVVVRADEVVVARSGDTLYQIARRHGTTVEALMRSNQLTSPDRILIGQVIQIPRGSPAAAGGSAAGRAVGAVTAAPADPSPAAAADPLYVVQLGDNLFRIALRHGTSVATLMRLNGLISPDRIFAGQALRLPGSAGGIGTGGTVESGGTGGASGPGAVAGAPAYRVPASAADAVRYPVGRQVVIDLSDQTLTAYENGAVQRMFVVSTGAMYTPTPIGRYTIYNRYLSQDMSGPGYYAPGVPYVQYFVGAYSIHGTYWHDSFGTPVSHGCVNMRTPEAEWLWSWANVGTQVIVQP